MKTVVKIKHGSHLYGTNTETSDTDYKGVHIPDRRSILLQRSEKTHDGSTNKSYEKNSKDDIDFQSYPVFKFYEMISKGDTTAIEILFAPEDMIVEQSDQWPAIREMGMEFINAECKGFVGYCQRQAAKYGIRGSRMASVEKASVMLAELIKDLGPRAKLNDAIKTIETFAENDPHSELRYIEGANGKVKHFVCVDRALPYNTTLEIAYSLYNRIYKNYGARAEAAKENEGIDWKAVSHAIRVANQAIELLETGHVTFPRPEADYLLQVKRGELKYEDVSKVLEDLVEKVGVVSEKSTLPAETDMEELEKAVEAVYFLSCQGTFDKK